jgi:hypothetical protein
MSRDQDEILLGGVDSDLADRYRTAKQKVRERTGVVCLSLVVVAVVNDSTEVF